MHNTKYIDISMILKLLPLKLEWLNLSDAMDVIRRNLSDVISSPSGLSPRMTN